jgi:hypothetical protein
MLAELCLCIFHAILYVYDNIKKAHTILSPK